MAAITKAIRESLEVLGALRFQDTTAATTTTTTTTKDYARGNKMRWQCHLASRLLGDALGIMSNNFDLSFIFPLSQFKYFDVTLIFSSEWWFIRWFTASPNDVIVALDVLYIWTAMVICNMIITPVVTYVWVIHQCLSSSRVKNYP